MDIFFQYIQIYDAPSLYVQVFFWVLMMLIIGVGVSKSTNRKDFKATVGWLLFILFIIVIGLQTFLIFSE